jgi:hypothetical protein
MSPLKRFSILRRVHRGKGFETESEHDDFKEKLAALVQKGIVENVPVNTKHESSLDEEAWFRDKRTGIVYRYIPPDRPSIGFWGPVDDPGTPSFFETLMRKIYPTRAEYDQLVAALDQAWRAKQIVAAQPAEQGELVQVFFHNPAQDETYQLILANPYQKGGSWMKVYHSEKDGSWPGELIIGPPPWYRPKAS